MTIHCFQIAHNTSCLPSKILQNYGHFGYPFSLGMTVIPIRYSKQWSHKIWGANQGVLWASYIFLFIIYLANCKLLCFLITPQL